jgi:hypothetical protein
MDSKRLRKKDKKRLGNTKAMGPANVAQLILCVRRLKKMCPTCLATSKEVRSTLNLHGLV